MHRYLLDRCNAYGTQAALVTGFAFTAFSPDALQQLSWDQAPVRSMFFVCVGATTMALSIGSVSVSTYLTGKAERLAMEADVRTAVALVRWRMPWVVMPYHLSLLCLWTSATLLVFTTCKKEDGDKTVDPHDLCEKSGILVIVIFVCIGGFLLLFPRFLIGRDTQKAFHTAGVSDAPPNSGAGVLLRENDSAAGGAQSP